MHDGSPKRFLTRAWRAAPTTPRGGCGSGHLAASVLVRVADVAPGHRHAQRAQLALDPDRAGVREGDIITEFDGIAIEHMDELYRMLTEERVGKTTEMVVLRGLELQALMITPATR